MNDITQQRLPGWLHADLPRTPRAGRVDRILAAHGLDTVCREARCPNRGACRDAGTATFLLLGRVCARGCAYCSVTRGAPSPTDPSEPARLAAAVRDLGLDYAVVTAVTRDDLPDGGAGAFVAAMQNIRRESPRTLIEVLVPDFLGDSQAARAVAQARPAVFGHNLETVEALFPSLRPGGGYERSLSLISDIKRAFPRLPLKSGLMAGLGETRAQLRAALQDLHAAGCDLVTVGQYLRPAPDRAPVRRFLPPDEFEDIRREALGMGFAAALCGPLVRSSFGARDLALTMIAG
jgi:lipoic acid synthetase